ncbi:aldose sugar dehydrogenase [Escherichia coli]|uniref:Aldose sugar dehydrogenase n=1 Tax=Escherichia coli TaxID=562 RepID=A0A2X1IXN6_ECOLX|nr:aldose sugar dehydrogenase [Escherichia coli]
MNMARAVVMKINIPQKGKNYGWPLATWGINYSGFKIPEAKGEDRRRDRATCFLLERFARCERHGLL